MYGEEQAEILTKKLDEPERPVPLKCLSGGQTSYNYANNKIRQKGVETKQNKEGQKY